MIKNIHIYDLDGTLCNSEHRFRTLPNGKIDLPFWRDNSTAEMIAKDSVKELATKYKKQLDSGEDYVVIATARIMCEASLKWVKENIGLPHKIVSRVPGDDRKGAKLKIDGLRYLKNFKQFSKAKIFVYEDNPEYLYPMAEFFNAVPVFCESNQGV